MPDLKSPRHVHSALAHQLLAKVAFEQPRGFIGIMASDDAREFLSKLITPLLVHRGEPDPSDEFTANDLSIYSGPIAGNPAVILEMPPARAASEAFFVAAILFSWPGGPPLLAGFPALRYFTLELGIAGSPPRGCTLLCERDEHGTHIDLGEGPAPTVDEFVRAIEMRLQGN